MHCFNFMPDFIVGVNINESWYILDSPKVKLYAFHRSHTRY
jgi:hypothetical protein